MANLAFTLWNLGRWTEAEALEVVVMDTRKRVLGEEHPDTLTSMANLESMYYREPAHGDDTEAFKVSESHSSIVPHHILTPNKPLILELIGKLKGKTVVKIESEVD
jgi:hypothetical protein